MSTIHVRCAEDVLQALESPHLGIRLSMLQAIASHAPVVEKLAGPELARLQSGAYAALAMSAAIRTDLDSAGGAVVLAAQAVGWFELVDDWPARSAAFSDLRTAMMGIISPSVEERAAQAELLRCIFGNPFHPAAFDPGWLLNPSKVFPLIDPPRVAEAA